MNKDIVYIDVEDDITAIIGKVKAAKEKIVALVPPQRIGVLQSAVNLRLLDRAAKQHDKQIVVITGNQALTSLAAAAKIPVAKNLQSKPELGEIAAIDVNNGEEVIDGAELAVGDHAASVGVENSSVDLDKAVGAVAAAEAEKNTSGSRKAKGKKKVPDFSSFRKKFFLIGAALVAVIAFLVWAIVFAPHATIVINAKTTDAGISQQVTVATTAQTSAETTQIQAAVKSSTQNINTSFTATGSKNVGDKATGTIKFSTTSPSGASIPAGTTFTVSGLTFGLDTAVTVPGATLSFSCGGICPGTASGSISAPEGGAKYNGAQGSASGAPAGVSASVPTATSGGTDKTATVVQQSDVDTALDSAKKSLDVNAAKQALQGQFGKDYIVLSDSINADTSQLQSSIKVGSDVQGATPAITGTVTYTLYAVKKDELKTYLDAVIAQQFDNPDRQRVYDSGASNAQFSNVQPTKDGVTATLVAKGKIGPKIDTDAVKQAARGKKLGDVQNQLKQISGIDSVTVNFSPFWVNTVPNDTKKISVKFSIDG